MTRQPASPAIAAEPAVPGDGILHPAVLVAIALLIVNDHALKTAWPGPLTGKLSDVAGLAFFPALLAACWEVASARLGRTRPSVVSTTAVAAAATALVFASVKTSPVLGTAVGVVMSTLQVPFAVAAWLLAGVPMPPFGEPATIVVDPTDLAALPAVALPVALAARRAGVAWAAPEGWWRDLALAGLAVGLLLGAIVDGWAHVHDPGSLETVLTPWHAVVYVAFGAIVVTTVGPLVPRAFGWPAAADARRPDLVVLAGIALFLVAGLADTAWHVAFGLEADAEALVSPSHLLLGVGAGLIAVGPARTAWRSRLRPTWPGLLPATVAIATVTGLLAFATHLAHPLVDPLLRWPYDAEGPATWAVASLGVASAVLQAAILGGGLVVLLRLWPAAPAGAPGLVVLLSSAPLLILHDTVALLPAVLAGAVAAELAHAATRGRSAALHLAVVGGLVPAAIWGAEVGLLAAVGQVAWSAHLIGGTLVAVGVIGSLVGLLGALPGPGATATDRRGRDD